MIGHLNWYAFFIIYKIFNMYLKIKNIMNKEQIHARNIINKYFVLD